MTDKNVIRNQLIDILARLDILRANGMEHTKEYKSLSDSAHVLSDVLLNNSTERS